MDSRGRKRKTPQEALASHMKSDGLSALVDRLRADWPAVSYTYLWQIKENLVTPSWSRGELIRAACGLSPPPLTLKDAIDVLVEEHGLTGAAACISKRLATDSDSAKKSYVDAQYLSRIRSGTTDPRWPLGNTIVDMARELLAQRERSG